MENKAMHWSKSQPPSIDYIAVQQADLRSSSPMLSQPTHNVETSPRSNRKNPTIPVVENADDVANASKQYQAGAKDPQSAAEEQITTLLPRKEWRSWKISWWFNIAVLMIELGFIIAIIILDKISARDDGIVTVPNMEYSSNLLTQLVVSKVQRYYGLLWTSLPSLVFALYAIAWAAVVAACYDRQPFVELHRGSDVQRTVMLDYRAYPEFYSWIIALMHNHIHIGCAILLSVILSIAVVPLSARLFVAAASAHKSDVALSFTSQYNDSILIGNINLQPFIDISTAVHAYGSTPPAWMTTEYAFIPFYTTDLNSINTSANLSATTDAYSAYLDCQAMSDSSHTVSYTDQGTDQGNDLGNVAIKFSDRSCSVQMSITLSSNTPTYARTWYQVCKGQTVNRLVMVAGTYSPSSSSRLNDLSIVSCIPSYWHSTGLLTVSHHDPSSLLSNYISFDQHNSTALQPVFANTLETSLQQYTIFNSAAATNADALGFSILSAAITASNRSTEAAMQPGVIRDAMEQVFTTIYAGFAASNLLTPTSVPSASTGVMLEPVNRLYVTQPIAYFIVIVLCLVLANHIWLWIYAIRHKSILSEEPVGLLGHAILLESSDVSAVIRRVQEMHGQEAEVRDGLKKRFNIRNAKCFWDEIDRRIKIEGLHEK